MYGPESAQPLPKQTYALGSKVSQVAPLFDAPRFFSHTAPIIHPPKAELKTQPATETPSWLAQKFERFLNLVPSSGIVYTPGFGESTCKEDLPKMTYQKCIQLHLPIEKCKQLEHMKSKDD